MANPYYTEFEEHAATKTGGNPKKVHARPVAPEASGTKKTWTMPRLPGVPRRIHKVFGRRVRTSAQETI